MRLCKGKTMAAETTDVMIRKCLRLMSEKLDQAAAIARAARTCAEAGSQDRAIQIVFDVETRLYDARTLLAAVALFNREVRDDAPR